MDAPQHPNTGRIIDHWLGGNHHFPVDVEAARVFEAIYPESARVFATLRGFIGRATRAVADAGIRQFLVLGAGIPAQGNVHEAAPGARVLYTDIDRVNIELGKQILAGQDGVEYAYCDAADPSTLDRDAMSRVLDLARPLGVVFVGVSAFFDDDTARRTLDALHDLAAPGSYLIADFDGEAMKSYPAALALLAQAGEPLHMRGVAQIQPLLGRWQLSADGIQPVDTWRNPGAAPPELVFMYGCVASKPG